MKTKKKKMMMMMKKKKKKQILLNSFLISRKLSDLTHSITQKKQLPFCKALVKLKKSKTNEEE